jgi:hypothetical protein
LPALSGSPVPISSASADKVSTRQTVFRGRIGNVAKHRGSWHAALAISCVQK